MSPYEGSSLFFKQNFESQLLNLTKSGPWEVGSTIRNIIKISYRKGNIDIESYCKSFKSAEP